MFKKKQIFPLFFVANILFIFSNSMAYANSSVFVSISPQKYFVQQIGGDLVEAHVMVLPGASPHAYEPRPKQMVEVAKAKIYFAIGVEFEKVWLRKIASSNPKMKIIHTDRGVNKLTMVSHHHGEHDKHSGSKNLDPHIWLSPAYVKSQAKIILAALNAMDPANKSLYEANFTKFIAKIDRLDSELSDLFSKKKGVEFMVFHPSWGYFAHSYGLKQVPVEFEGKAPKPAQLQGLIKHAKKHGIKVVFAQPQFSKKRAELIAKEIGGEVVLIDPLAENWMENMREVARIFKTALK